MLQQARHHARAIVIIIKSDPTPIPDYERMEERKKA
jgi:hypothetical protein